MVYSRSVSDTERSLDAGTYYLLFEVYDKRTVVEDPLNPSDSVPFMAIDHKGLLPEFLNMVLSKQCEEYEELKKALEEI